MKPTWDIVEFNDDIGAVPCFSRGLRKLNPLDRNVAVYFEPARREYVYYLPRNGRTIVSERELYGEKELSEAFGTTVTDYFHVKEAQGSVRTFLYEMVIGECLVYRVFEIKAECRKTGEKEYECTVSPPSEVRRYVFGIEGVSVEESEHTQKFITADLIEKEEAYDTLKDADAESALSLYQAFVHNVKIDHKAEMIRALSFVKKDYPKLGIEAFTEIYRWSVEEKNVPEDTPERIVRELNCRSHKPGTAVRIDKDLVVMTGERKCRYLKCCEETRTYFDDKRAYYFRRNPVTFRWEADDLREQLVQNREIRYTNVDKDVFDNTCAEKFAGYSVDKDIPTGSKIRLGQVLAQTGFLSAEQAAKTDRAVFNVIIDNIYEGRLLDGDRTLSDLLGITGAQIKFLRNIKIPGNLEEFAKCMEAEDFREHFPDVKKRIFAVAFYLNGFRPWHDEEDLTREDIFGAAQTLNSLEKSDAEDRERLLEEYRDYLRMHRSYREYAANMQEDDPLRQEIEDFGEVPVNLKPSRIRDAHNKLGRIVDIIGCSGQITKYTAAIEERHEKEAASTEYTDGSYSILMPKNAIEIIREGRELQHCVGRAGYIQAMAAGRCTILFLRDNKDLNTPLITIEVRDGSIMQCYGFRDSYNKDPGIRDFVKEYASLHGLEIYAVICLD